MQPEKPPQWFNTARSIINEYRTVLDKCTRFPKAGERNVKVEDLVDLSVAVWEASGAIADRAQWVIDVSEPSIFPRPFLKSQVAPLVGYPTDLQLLSYLSAHVPVAVRLWRYGTCKAYLALVY